MYMYICLITYIYILYVYAMLCTYMYVCCTGLLLTLSNLCVEPSEPQQLEIDSVSSTSVTLRWMPPKYPNGVITKYSVHCDGVDIDKFGDVSDDNMIGTVERLSPNSVYILKMKAYTQVGSGPPVSLAVKTRKLNVGV